jgi:penicillin amidase
MLLLALLVLLPVFAYGGLRWLAAARRPQLDGTLHHPALTAPVTVTRDAWGVPHIEAEHETDAYFALGYTMAQDRLFQMELLTRLAKGELAEIVGPPALVIDKALRTLRLRAKAEENLAALAGGHPEVFAAASAFLDGVNHFSEHGPRPFECTLLGIPRRTYTLVDSLCIAGILPITFSYGPRQDAMFTIMQERFPDIDMRLLFPGYTQGVPATIMESLEEAEAILRERGLAPFAAPGANAARVGEGLAPFVTAWQWLSETLGGHMGSNSWVLAPSRTESRNALLANDPHIGFTNPSIWYEAHLRYGDFDNYGYYLPLIPIALLGHNTDRGWGLTMFANDDVDLFVETLNPENPNEVMHRGAWVPLRTETERIGVRFGEDVDLPVRITPHGPIITPLLEQFEGYTGPPVALYWVWQHVEYTDIVAFYRMAHARTYEDFADAVRLVTSPGVNVSYADRLGNIAWWAAGKIPVRPPHVNSKALLDGASGRDEYLGFLPFDQNPHLKNPPSGYIATANNKSSVQAFGPIAELEGYWQPWDRAERIEQALETRERWSAAQTMELQVDGVGIAAPGIVGAVRDALAGRMDALGAVEREALDRLAQWDGDHAVEAVAPTIYTYLCDAILEQTVADELGPLNYRVYGTLGDAWNFLRYVVHRDDSPFWDDRNTPAVESRADILARALADATRRLRENFGPDPAQWTWGRAHTVTYTHPLGYLPIVGRIFNVGPLASPGGAQTINNMLHPHGFFNHKIIAGPSTRRVIDFSDPEHSHTILPTGNSGHWRTPHYDDQAEMFVRGEYREAVFTRDQIAASARHTLRLLPAP